MAHHLGFRHKNERKRQGSSARSAHIRFLDRVTLIAGIVGPFTVIPQVWEIFSSRDASGVSLTAWVLLTLVTLPWIFYGFAHRDKSIIISFILWEVVNIAVVVGILLYG